MRPQALRHVAKRGLLNEFLILGRCPNRLPFLLPPNAISPIPSTIQSRSLFIPKFLKNRSGNKGPQKEPPGLKVLRQLTSHLDEQIGARPQNEQVMRAIEQFVGSTKHINDDQAYSLLRAYEYLRSYEKLPLPLLQRVLAALHIGTANQIKLARKVYADILSIDDYELSLRDLHAYIRVLCRSGSPHEAADMCWAVLGKLEGDKSEIKPLLITIMNTLAKNDMGGLLSMLRRMEENDLVDGRDYHLLISSYCEMHNIPEAIAMYDKLVERGLELSWETRMILVKYCIETGNFKWADSLAEKMMADTERRSLSYAAWNVVLQWAALRKGIDEVERLLTVMNSRVGSGTNRSEPTINSETFNRLIESLLQSELQMLKMRKRREMIERLFELQEEWGVENDQKGLRLRLKFYAATGKLEKAKKFYDDFRLLANVQAEDSVEIRAFLRALAKKPSPDTRKTIAEIYNDLVDWNVHIDSGTLSAILTVYMADAAFGGVQTLLDSHVGYYTPEHRAKIIDLCLNYIFQPNNSVEASWDMYKILVRKLPEVTLEQRGKLMKLFFELGQPRMAVQVMTDMSKTDMSQGRTPTKYQYTAAFVGIAQSGDLDGLLKLHRQLNMDPFVVIDTILLNSIMHAYASCNLPQKAINLYEEISRSPEGPDEATISIVLDVYGKLPGDGVKKAKKLWDNLKAMGVPLTQNMYTSYIETLARHQRWDEAFEVFRGMEEDGVKPGPRVVSTLFMTFRRDRLLEVEAYLEKHYADVWEEVKRELNATAPREASLAGRGYIFVDVQGNEIEEPKYKTSVNLPGSEGYDEAKAKRDREEWEREGRSRDKHDMAEILLGQVEKW